MYAIETIYKYKSLLLFLLFCIPLRIFLAYLAKTGSHRVQQIIAVFASAVAIGFMYIYVTGSRQVGAETFGAKIWWNHFRPIHAFLYAYFAWLVFVARDYENAWIPLGADVVVGLAASASHYIL
jgi:hypothetical protein